MQSTAQNRQMAVTPAVLPPVLVSVPENRWQDHRRYLRQCRL